MEIFSSIQELGKTFSKQPIALSIGMFDGVHLGHKEVLSVTSKLALSLSGISCTLTFPMHPASYLRPDKAPPLIMCPEEKAKLLLGSGIQAVVMREFDQGFSSIHADDFIDFLKARIPSLFAVCVGRNFKFGKERTGDSQLLAKKGGNSGIKIEIIDSKIMDGQAISSSRIRIALSSGKIDQVNEMLGRNYMIGGPVKIGKGIGRKFGFPTLNLDWDPESRPAYGVYSGFLSDESGHPRFPAVANYGLRPTVESGDSIPKLEIHALNDLNSEEWKPEKWVNMELCKFIRVEKKFESIDQLSEQISEDKQTAIQWFEGK